MATVAPFPAVRASSAKVSGTTAALSVTEPVAVAVGDLEILFGTTIAGGSLSITTAGGSAWTALGNQDVTSGEKLYVWWRIRQGGDSAPSITPGSDHATGGIVAYVAGTFDTTTPIEVFTTGSKTSASTAFSFAPGVSSTKNNSIVGCICTSGQDTATNQVPAMANTSLTKLALRHVNNSTSGGGGGFGYTDGQLAVAGSVGTFTATLANSVTQAYAAWVIRPSTSGLLAAPLGGTVLSGSLGSITLPFTSAVNEGDLVYVACDWAVGLSSDFVSTVADTKGNTWTFANVGSTTESGTHAWCIVAVGKSWLGNGDNSVVFTLNTGTPGGRLATAATIPKANMAASSQVDQHVENNTQTGVTHATATTAGLAQAKEIILSTVANRNTAGTASATADSPATLFDNLAGSGTPASGLAMSEQETSATTAVTVGFTTGSGNAGVGTLAVKSSVTAVVGSAASTITITGLAAGTASHHLFSGTAPAVITITGLAAGSVHNHVISGSAAGSITVTGLGAGTASHHLFSGTAPGTVTITGLGAGAATDHLFVGSAAGVITIVGAAVGRVVENGAASSTVTITGLAVGHITEYGSAASTITFTGLAAGIITMRKANNFDTGSSSGTSISNANSGGGSGNTAIDAAAGTAPKYSSVLPHSGALAMLLAPAASSMITWNLANEIHIFGRFYINPSALPTTSIRLLNTTGNVTGVNLHRIAYAATTGLVSINLASLSSVSSVNALTLGAYSRVEFECIVNGTTATINLRLFLGSNCDGLTPDETISTSHAETDTALTLIGYGTGSNPTPSTIYMDDVEVNNTAFPGPSLLSGTAVGTLSVVGAAAGTASTHAGVAAGVITITGFAAGTAHNHVITGSAASSVAITGAAAGHGISRGTAASSITIVGLASGRVTVQIVHDEFERTTSSPNLGTADTGQSYGTFGTVFADGHTARVGAAAGSGEGAYAIGPALIDSETLIKVTPSALPDDIVSYFLLNRLKSDFSQYYNIHMYLTNTGFVGLSKTVFWPGGSFDAPGADLTLDASYTPGNSYWLRFQTVGSTLRWKAWKDGSAEPDWTFTTTDTNVVYAGTVGFQTFSNGGLGTGFYAQFDSFNGESYQASAASLITITGQATGRAIEHGSGASTITITGLAAGTAHNHVISGTAPSTVTITGLGAGTAHNHVLSGTGASTITITGLGAGTASHHHFVGSGASTITITGLGAGTASHHLFSGTGPAVITITGLAAGRARQKGSAASTITITGHAAGIAGVQQPLILPVFGAHPKYVLASTGKQILLRGADVLLTASTGDQEEFTPAGANFARVVLNWDDLEPTAPTGSGTVWSSYVRTLDSGVLSDLDTLCSYYAANGIYFQLDFHQAGWSQYFGGDSAVPSWYYTDSRFTAQQNGGAGWNNTTDKSTAIKSWWIDSTEKTMSQGLYIGFVIKLMQWAAGKSWYPYAVGYNTFNEPNIGNMTGSNVVKTGNIHAWLAPVVDAMHSFDAYRCLWVMCRGGGQGYGTSTFSEFTDLHAQNVCIEFHQYYTGLAPGAGAVGGSDVGYDVNGDEYVPDSNTVHNTTSGSTYHGDHDSLKAFTEVPLNAANALGCPALLGECGVHYDDTGRLSYIAQLTDICDELGLSNAVWKMGVAPADELGICSSSTGTLNDMGSAWSTWWLATDFIIDIAGTSTLTITGLAAGHITEKAVAHGVITITGSVLGHITEHGILAGTIAITGLAAGAATHHLFTGSAASTITITGLAAGTAHNHVLSGTAASSITIIGAAAGSAKDHVGWLKVTANGGRANGVVAHPTIPGMAIGVGDVFGHHTTADGGKRWVPRLKNRTVVNSGISGNAYGRTAAWSKKNPLVCYMGGGTINGNAGVTAKVDLGGADPYAQNALTGSVGFGTNPPNPLPDGVSAPAGPMPRLGTGALLDVYYTGSGSEYLYAATHTGITRWTDEASPTLILTGTFDGAVVGNPPWKAMIVVVESGSPVIYAATYGLGGYTSVLYRISDPNGTPSVTTIGTAPAEINDFMLLGTDLYAVGGDKIYAVTAAGATWTQIDGGSTSGHIVASLTGATRSGVPTIVALMSDQNDTNKIVIGTFTSSTWHWSWIDSSVAYTGLNYLDNSTYWLATIFDNFGDDSYMGAMIRFDADGNKLYIAGTQGMHVSDDMCATVYPAGMGFGGSENTNMSTSGIGSFKVSDTDWTGISTTNDWTTYVKSTASVGTDSLTFTLGLDTYVLNLVTPATMTKNGVAIHDAYFQGACINPRGIAVDPTGVISVGQFGGGILRLIPPKALSGQIQITGAAAGTASHHLFSGTGASVITVQGLAAGHLGLHGSGAGSVAISGAAAGTASTHLTVGAAASLLVIAGLAQAKATANGAIVITGSAAGTASHHLFVGSAASTITVTGLAAGSVHDHVITGSAASTITVTGLAAGHASHHLFSGTAAGVITILGAATGHITEHGSGASTIAITGAAAGTASHHVFVGRAVSHRVLGTSITSAQTLDATYSGIVKDSFSGVTPEWEMQWGQIEPSQGTFDFTAMDAIVDFAVANGLEVTGHTLIWWAAGNTDLMPTWITGGTWTKATLSAVLKNHIQTIVNRYKDRVHIWNVANEAFADDGSRVNWIFQSVIGDEWIELAFRYAYEADPAAVLRYNDYGIDWGFFGGNAKYTAVLAMLTDFHTRSVPCTGVGLQGHYDLQFSDYPDPTDVADVIASYRALGYEVAVTELDCRVDNVSGSTATKQTNQATVYHNIRTALQNSGGQSLTVWGVSDATNWEGTTAAAAPFDVSYQPKPAWFQINTFRRNLISSSATGVLTLKGTGSSTVTITGHAQGAGATIGSANGAISITGAGSGRAIQHGALASSISITGLSAGHASNHLFLGTGHSSINVVGLTAGRITQKGLAESSINVTGIGHGRAVQFGTGSSTISIAGDLAGLALDPVVFGVATSTFTITGIMRGKRIGWIGKSGLPGRPRMEDGGGGLGGKPAGWIGQGNGLGSLENN